MSHAAFLKAILAEPADDLPRLVYADYLDEVGEAERAEFIRIQVALASRPEIDPPERHLEDREHELLAGNEQKWLGGIQFDWQEWEWRRGFVDEIAATADKLNNADSRAFEEHPIVVCRLTQPLHEPDCNNGGLAGRLVGIRKLILSDLPFSVTHNNAIFGRCDLPKLEALDCTRNGHVADSTDLLRYGRFRRQIREFQIGGTAYQRGGISHGRILDVQDLKELLEQSALERLTAYDSGLETSGLRQLLMAPFMATLKHLDISDNPLAPDAYRAFELAHTGLQLDSLDVSSTPLAGISLSPLLASRANRLLTKLEINGCGSARRNMEVLADSPFWSQASSLRAHSGTIPASTLEPICRSSGPPALRLLDLADNYLRTDGIAELLSAEWIKPLTWLSLSANYLDDESCRVLARSRRLGQLRTLHLAQNNVRLPGGDFEQITDAGVHALARASGLANLRLLTLGSTGITTAGVDAALHSPHWRLSGLGVSGNELSEDVVPILANSPRLARLTWLDLADNHDLGGSALLPLAESPYLSPLCELDCGGLWIDPTVSDLFRERLGVRFSY